MKRCKTCRWFDGGNDYMLDGDGFCRINPPVAFEHLEYGIWPATNETQWCGRWEAKPEPEVIKGPSIGQQQCDHDWMTVRSNNDHQMVMVCQKCGLQP